jgi:hypothetical protein
VPTVLKTLVKSVVPDVWPGSPLLKTSGCWLKSEPVTGCQVTESPTAIVITAGEYANPPTGKSISVVVAALVTG